MPSMLPKVGSGKRRGVFYNTGHGHLGWTLSAATAHSIAQCMYRARGNRLTQTAPHSLVTAAQPEHQAQAAQTPARLT